MIIKAMDPASLEKAQALAAHLGVPCVPCCQETAEKELQHSPDHALLQNTVSQNSSAAQNNSAKNEHPAQKPSSEKKRLPQNTNLQGSRPTQNNSIEDGPIALTVSETGVALTDGTQSMAGDLRKLLPRLRYNNLTHEAVVKAAKGKNIPEGARILDATAGMGEDSLLLAAAGFSVTLCEYNPVIAALLRDSLERAKKDPELSEIVGRMTLHEGDSVALMQEARGTYDIVLLDPMFPERKKSGLVKKKFQLLQQLELPCSTEEALLSGAMSACPKRILIKRPMKGPYLAGKKPSYSLNGKSVRYDVILL